MIDESTELIDKNQVLDLISETGKFSTYIPGFEYRKEQQQLLEKIIDAFNEKKILVSEAGTGVGKSLAYLLPAVFSQDKKVIISTNTKALQDQLFLKDIPLIQEVLGGDDEIKCALAKGKNNYLCLKRADYMEHLNDFAPDEINYLQELPQTKDGVNIEYEDIPPTLWEKICCDDICTSKKCKFYQDCFLMKAKAKIQEAKIVICNHHLLTCDLAVRSETDNYQTDLVLPNSKKLIIDEGHNFEDIFIKNFTQEVSKKGIHRFLLLLYNQNKSTGVLVRLEKSLNLFDLNESDVVIEKRISDLKTQIVEKIEIIDTLFGDIYAYAKNFAKGGMEVRYRVKPEIAESVRWKKIISEKLLQISNHLLSIATELELLKNDVGDAQNKEDDFSSQLQLEFDKCYKSMISSRIKIDSFLSIGADKNLRWIETYKENIKFNITPIDISELLENSLYPNYETVVYTSATLSTNKDFSFFEKKLGINRLDPSIRETILVQSPFDYQNHSLFILPDIQEDPNNPAFTSIISEYIKKICLQIKGRTFVLFTSFAMLNKVHSSIQKDLKSHHITCLSQSEHSKETLTEKFKKLDKAVLLGTSTFWEGVDIQGEKLQCVIITKLPFMVPDDPIVEAKMDFIEAQGGNSFTDYMIPEAAIKLKQGFGRLIRSKRDYGSVWCFDNRVTRKAYGKKFINSLPPSKQVISTFDKCFDTFKTFHETFSINK